MCHSSGEEEHSAAAVLEQPQLVLQLTLHGVLGGDAEQPIHSLEEGGVGDDVLAEVIREQNATGPRRAQAPRAVGSIFLVLGSL